MIRVETQVGGADGWEAATAAQLASGRVDAALALFFDTAMALRQTNDLRSGDALAGMLLECEAPADMAPDAFARAMSAIDASEGAAREPRPGAFPELIRLPANLRAAVARAEAESGWKAMTPGIRQLKLAIPGSQARAEVLRIAPGAATPRHTHAGSELTLCLLGGYSDGRGAYGPGDISVADPSVHHQPRAHDDGVCYVLAITDADLRFEGLLGLVQRLLNR